MSITKKLLVLSAIVLQSYTSVSQIFDKTEIKILQAQDSRNVSEIKNLYDKGELIEDKYLIRALIALANIADTNYDYVKPLIQLFENR